MDNNINAFLDMMAKGAQGAANSLVDNIKKGYEGLSPELAEKYMSALNSKELQDKLKDISEIIKEVNKPKDA